jgi:S1-C subfamily serine protease
MRRNLVALAIVALALGGSLVYALQLSAQNQQSATPTTLGAASSATTALLNLQAATKNLSQAAGAVTPSSSRNAQTIYGTWSRSVVTVQGDQTVSYSTFRGVVTTTTPILGSGFSILYQSAYYVVTNFHVVDAVGNLTVTFSNGDAFPAKVVGTDPLSDLAVVSVSSAPSSEFVPLNVVFSSNAAVGDTVYAIGNPFGLSGSITSGIISQLGRTIQETTSSTYSIAGVIQFSAAINPGNSGGPLFDGAGNVIGITTATVSGSTGLGFAIPSSALLRELPSIITSGTYASHSYLGVSGADMNYALAQAEKTNVTYGVLVENVASGSAASTAGLHAGTTSATIEGSQYLVGGDVVVSVNGTRIVNQDALSTYLEQNTVAGQTVELGLVRSGSFTTVAVTLGASSSPV